MVDVDIKATIPSAARRVSNCLVFFLICVCLFVTQTSILGRSDLEISAKFPNPLTPAAWAFTIWGAILGLQAVGVVYQAMPQGYKSDGMKQRYINGIGWYWQLSWVAEMVWQMFFQLETALGMVLCLASLAIAFAAMGRCLFNMYRLKQEHGSLSNILLYVAFFLPTSIHTAWLSYASGLAPPPPPPPSTEAAMMVPKALDYTAHLDGLAAVLVALITGLGVAIVQKHRDSAYGLTIVWALVAVYGQQQNSKYMRVVTLICVCVSTLASIFSMLRRKSPGPQAELSETRQPLSRINSA